MSVLRVAIVAVACLQVAACLPATRLPLGDDGTTLPQESVQIEVLNDHTSEVIVFLMRGVERRQLGTVTPGATGRFQVPGRLSLAGLELRLTAEPIDRSWTCATEPFFANPGERTLFSLKPNGQLSRLR
jgi:hypothetical protein